MQIGVGIGFWGGGRAKPIQLIGPGYIAPGLTFTRASAASFLDATGALVLVGSDVPRFQGGRLLMEGARPNLIVRSGDPTHAAWATSQISVVASGFPPPPGFSPVGKFTPNTTLTPSHYVSMPNVAFSAGLYTASIVACAAEYSVIQMLWGGAVNASDYANFDLVAGTVTAGSNSGARIVPLGGGYYRCSITSVLAAATANAIVARALTPTMGRLATSYAGNGNDGFYIVEGQPENGGFPSSIIPTTTAAVTRAQDSLSGLISALNLPSTGFTLILRASMAGLAAANDKTLICVDTGANADRFAVIAQGSIATNTLHSSNTSAGSFLGGASLGAVSDDTMFGCALTIQSGRMATSLNAGAVQVRTGQSTATMTTLRVAAIPGGAPGFNQYGLLSAIPYVVPDAQLPALAAGAL